MHINQACKLLLCRNGSTVQVPTLVPCSGHVDSDLLQQTLPVTDIEVGPSGPNLRLDVQMQRLQLAVCLPFEHRLHICAHSCVDALTTIACESKRLHCGDIVGNKCGWGLLPAAHTFVIHGDKNKESPSIELQHLFHRRIMYLVLSQRPPASSVCWSRPLWWSSCLSRSPRSSLAPAPCTPTSTTTPIQLIIIDHRSCLGSIGTRL